MAGADHHFGIEDFIGVLVEGDAGSGLVGLGESVEVRFPQKDVNVTPWYPPNTTVLWPKKLPTIAAFLTTNSVEHRFFKHDKLPGNPTNLGWAREQTLQVNIYGRTRPELSDLQDWISTEMRVLGVHFWEHYRVRIGELQDSGTPEVNPQEGNAFWNWLRWRVTLPQTATLT